MNINNFYFSGTIESVQPVTMRDGKTFAKGKINQRKEYNGKVSVDTIEVTAFGEVSAKLLALKQGAHVLLAGKLSGRWTEFNGKSFLSESRIVNTIAALPDVPVQEPDNVYPSATETDVSF